MQKGLDSAVSQMDPADVKASRAPERCAPPALNPKDIQVGAMDKIKSPSCAPRLLSSVTPKQATPVPKAGGSTLGIKFADTYPYYGISRCLLLKISK